MTRIGNSGRECWATVAVNENQVRKALVLCRSLRVSMTNRPLCIILSHLIDEKLWQIVQSAYDIVIRLDENKSVDSFLYGKLFVWNLTHWDKVVFIHPDTMIVRNCDELFKLDELHMKSFENSEVFVVEPSKAIWEMIKRELSRNDIVNEKEIFTNIFKGQDSFHVLKEIYNIHVNIQGGLLTRNVKDLGIVTFKGLHPLEVNEKPKGVLESALWKIWKSHFQNSLLQSGPQSSDQMSKSQNENTDDHNSIAIIGLSCRFPGANSPSEFWNVMLEGRDEITNCPDGRWTPQSCPWLPDEAKRSMGGFLNCNIDEFDGKLFGVSPSELRFMDPQQRLLLQVAWEALEDGGIDPSSLKNSYTGVFGGAWRQDYRDGLHSIGACHDEYFRTYIGNAFGVITSRISHCLGLTGPSMTTESGCSSSIVAVHLACQSLLSGETDLNLACGINLLVEPFTQKAMSVVLSEEGRCKAFDKSADGFARAEGAGVLVLKRYADAIRDNNKVWGLIRGSAVVQEGASKSLGTPTKECQAKAISLALKSGGISPNEVSFIEAHGTGTAIGDPLEIAAIASVYSSPLRSSPLVIGSVKTNIGHTESASGIAGIIKVILCLQNELIPRHLNLKELNPNIDLQAIPAEIPLQEIKWPLQSQKPRIAGVSSFGITGTDAHILIQEPPTNPKNHSALLDTLQSSSSHEIQILTLSGKSKEALQCNVEQWKNFLLKEKSTEKTLENICFTANNGRPSFTYRTFAIGSSKEKLLEQLQHPLVGDKTAPEGICFLFTGQGSQYEGMAQDLYNSELTFKMHFDFCAEFLKSKYSIQIGGGDQQEGPNLYFWGDLKQSLYSQTSIFVVEYCLFKLWTSWGVKPSIVVGHSLGEFAAAVASNIISVEDALTLVAERARLIDALPEGQMLVLKAPKDEVEKLMKEAFRRNSERWLDYAAFNSQEQTVVSGDTERVQEFKEFCKNNNVKCTVLESTHAFHSRHMDPVLEKLGTVAKNIIYRKPTEDCKFISGMNGIEMKELDWNYWMRHTRDPVRFMDAIKCVFENEYNIFLELGPQPILCAMTAVNSMGRGLTPKCFPSIRKQESDWSCILSTLGKLYVEGCNINWENFYQWIPTQVASVPFYPFQNKSSWFEIPDQGPTEFHPLCGKPISNPSNMKLYSQLLSLDDNPYLRDHRIENKIIFPGAGFLEMCLVAGHAATQCTERNYSHPVAPTAVENFIIETPLELEDCNNTKMEFQTIVNTEENGEYRVTVYSKLILDSDTHKWMKHATATFHPFVVENQQPPSIVGLQSTLKDETLKIKDIYTKVSKFGLQFGPLFKTIEKMWTSTNEGDESTMFQVGVKTSISKYILHPLLSDAMFQSIMFSTPSLYTSIAVPVSIQKYVVWKPLSDADGSSCFIHCQRSKGGEIIATLYSNDNVCIAQMVGVVLLKTTVDAIMSSLEAQRLSLPDMYENQWRSQVGTEERRLDLKKVIKEIRPENVKEINEQFNTIHKLDAEFIRESEELYLLYVVKALWELDYIEILNTKIPINEIAKQMQVVSHLHGLLCHLLKELEYFEIEGESLVEGITCCQIKRLPCLEKVQQRIESLYEKVHNMSSMEVEFVSSTGKRLSSILRGTESALPYLFPKDGSSASAEAYYTECKMTKCFFNMCREYFSRSFPSSSNANLQEEKGTIRILEVGAGTGSFTKNMLPYLEPYSKLYEYTFTDITPVFFKNGEKVFQNSNVKVIFKVLNIEEDLFDQSCVPFNYDILIANNVIHATQNISRTLQNLRNLLRPGGLLLLSECTRPTLSNNLTFGLLDGYWGWLQEDYSLRGLNCEISASKWQQVLNSTGYNSFTCFPSFGNRISLMTATASAVESAFIPWTSSKKSFWLLFGLNCCIVTDYFHKKLLEMGKKVVLIIPSAEREIAQDFEQLFEKYETSIEGTIFLWGLDSSTKDIAASYLEICKSLINLDRPRIYSLTQGQLSIGDQDVTPPSASVLFAMTKCLKNEHPNSFCRVIDMDPSVVQINGKDSIIKEVFNELFLHDNEIYVAYRQNQRIVPRLVSWRPQNTALQLPSVDRFQVLLPVSGAINDLRFISSPTNDVGEDAMLGETEVEIKIESVALNFRDVLTVIKASKDFERMNTFGIDWSGRIVRIGSGVKGLKNGDDVFGMNLKGGHLASHLRIKENLCMKMNDKMTFGEAATLPVVSATVVCCLLEIAKLKKEDTILIHTGSGGVGLVAIQIAQSIGSLIITTAGSKRKRAYLRSIGVKHVFNSRNTDYESEIRQLTNGRGVDVVLNSLTSPGFKEASLAVCNVGARFIEMSILNIWTPDEVRERRKDVQYSTIDLSKATEDELQRYLETSQSLIEKNIIRPIPYTRFDAVEIRDALIHLQKARHVGKIIVTMPNSEGQSLLFNDRSTYLITGGLGGIGLQVCKWMLTSGAKYIVLVGRSKPSKQASAEVTQMNEAGGKNVLSFQYDVGIEAQCKELLTKLESPELNLPPLRGIMHAAGVLSDAIYANQTWEMYKKTYNPKVNGGWNLHNLTLNKKYRLEHFVMFSSAVACFGSLGQSNHSSANFFLDSLAHYRNYLGLPATTINWGQWGQVGVAVNVEFAGLKPFSTLQGISALETVMRKQKLQACVWDTDFSVVKQLFAGTHSYMEELNSTVSSEKQFVINDDEFWKEFDAAEDKIVRLDIMSRFVRSTVREILKFGKHEEMKDDDNFQELGMDSLMLIELRNMIQATFAKKDKVIVNAVQDCTTVTQLANKLLELYNLD